LHKITYNTNKKQVCIFRVATLLNRSYTARCYAERDYATVTVIRLSAYLSVRLSSGMFFTQVGTLQK